VPDPSLPIAELLPRSADPYIVLMLIGFVTGLLGHLTRARWLVAAGVMMIFLAVFLFPLAINLTTENPPPPVDTSR
jgi:hypothetical protein